MKGAKPDPAISVSKPKINSARSRGSNHHFLLCFMKPQNSCKKPARFCSAAACSNSRCFGSMGLLVQSVLRNNEVYQSSSNCARYFSRSVKVGGHDKVLRDENR